MVFYNIYPRNKFYYIKTLTQGPLGKVGEDRQAFENTTRVGKESPVLDKIVAKERERERERNARG